MSFLLLGVVSSRNTLSLISQADKADHFVLLRLDTKH